MSRKAKVLSQVRPKRSELWGYYAFFLVAVISTLVELDFLQQ